MPGSTPRQILVTGASGHIGANLVRALLDAGHAVRTLDIQDSLALNDLDITRCVGDVTRYESITPAFHNVDTVFHLATIITLKSSPDPLARLVNVDGVRNVVNACLQQGIRRLIHFSSIHAFSEIPRDQTIDEARPDCLGISRFPYDTSKAEGQRIVLEAASRGLHAVIIHPTAVLGPHDYIPSAMGRVLLDLWHGRLPALVSGGFNWVDVRDIVSGAITAAELGAPGEQYLLDGHYLSVSGLAALVHAAGGARPPRFTIPRWLAAMGLPFAAATSALTGAPPRFTRASLHALGNHQRVSYQKAAQQLHYAPRPIKQTIAETLDWFHQHGKLIRP